jgi:tryptophan synthase beta chain
LPGHFLSAWFSRRPASLPENGQVIPIGNGNEAKYQILEKENRLPNYVLACVGGGSNAMGTFYSFLHHPEVKIIGIEAGGKGLETEFNCASLSKGKVGVLHGFKNYVLQDDEGNIKEAYSISAGLDYPGVGPEICYLKKSGRAEFHAITDDEAVRAFSLLTKLEGIIPAIESSHAVAYLEKLMPETSKDDIIILNLSGRGDKDVDRLLEIIK